MVHSVKNAPFNLIGSPSFGDHPMKKCPHARLCAFVSERYDASEWMFKIMLDARYQMVGSGCVPRYSNNCLAFDIVFVVPRVCSLAIELRAMRTVMSTARA